MGTTGMKPQFTKSGVWNKKSLFSWNQILIPRLMVRNWVAPGMSCKREPILLLAEPSGLPASKARKFSMSVLLCPSVAMESWPRQGAQVSKIQPSCGSGRQPPPCPTLPPRVSPNPIPYMQDTATLTPFPFWAGVGGIHFLSLPVLKEESASTPGDTTFSLP